MVVSSAGYREYLEAHIVGWGWGVFLTNIPPYFFYCNTQWGCLTSKKYWF